MIAMAGRAGHRELGMALEVSDQRLIPRTVDASHLMFRYSPSSKLLDLLLGSLRAIRHEPWLLDVALLI